MTNSLGFANLGFGMGLRTKHFPYILENWPEMDWFEIISENFMDTDGRPVRVLEKIIDHYPVVMHGVSMSIGSTDPLNKVYLEKLKNLAEWVNPKWISDHLCWTGINNTDSHDLLPVPYTEEALHHISDRIKSVQDFLGRPLIIENPSTYLEFKCSQMPEWEFISRLAEESGCGLLLDINNIYVSCYNHNWDEKTYIDSIPADRVVQIHLAGHENNETHIVDTHEGPIIDPVWTLYRYTISQLGPTTTMVEWDTNIPSFEDVAAEVRKAKEMVAMPEMPNNIPSHYKETANDNEVDGDGALSLKFPAMHKAIISGNIEKSEPDKWIPTKKNLTPSEQLDVYVKGYRWRLFEIVSEDFPVSRHYLGDKTMDRLIEEYVEVTPSHDFNLAHYVFKFIPFAKSRDYLQNDKFATELIELETAITTVFDMEETKPLTGENLNAATPEDLLKTRLNPRKALNLYEFEYPVSDYYYAVKNDKKPKKPKRGKSYVAVYRHDDVVHRLVLDELEYKLLQTLFAENTIGEAIERLIEDGEVTGEKTISNFQEWFSRWINSGLLAA